MTYQEPYRPHSIIRSILPGLILLVILQAVAVALIEVEKPVDTLEYRRFAENLYEQGIYSYDGETPSRDRQPLYPMFLVIFYWFPGESELVVKLVQAVLGVITFIFAMLIYRSIIGEFKLTLPSLLLALYVPLWVNCAYLLTEALTIFLVTLGLYFLILAIQNNSQRACFVSGAAFALGVLTRPICIAPLLFGVLLVAFLPRNRLHRLPRVTMYLLAAVLVLLPWALRNGMSTGTFTPLSSEGQAHLIYASGPDTEERRETYLHATITERDSLLQNVNAWETLVEGVASNPAGFIWRGIKRVAWVWSYFPGTRDYFETLFFRIASHAVQLILIVFAVVGLAGVGTRERFLLLLLPVSFSLVLFFSGATSRFLLPAMVPVVLAALFGVILLVRQLSAAIGVRARV